MPVKMHQVFYFLALCEEQSFIRAARRCGVAQPSLTHAIQRLECEFGGQLFERNKSIVRLTNFGVLVRPDFERIGQATAALMRRVAELKAVPPTKSNPDPTSMEAFMRVVAIAVITAAIIITGLTLRPTPPATAAALNQARVQIDP
jgi:Bacterial regulatory helix-turn-helix protein, lysR family